MDQRLPTVTKRPPRYQTRAVQARPPVTRAALDAVSQGPSVQHGHSGDAVAGRAARSAASPSRDAWLARTVKRAIDLALLVPAVIVAVPLVLLGAIVVMIVSPGSPFFMQRREGLGGRTIEVWKLRTMHHEADRLLDRHLEADPEARAEWQRSFKLKRDPRLLPGVGSFLRRTSIDELPQLWSIAKGEMSFVGPRPFPEYHLAQFDPAFRVLRRSVLPGLTGLWQVSARSDGDLAVQQALDEYYIRNWSLWLDISLIARTPLALLSSRGAY